MLHYFLSSANDVYVQYLSNVKGVILLLFFYKMYLVLNQIKILFLNIFSIQILQGLVYLSL